MHIFVILFLYTKQIVNCINKLNKSIFCKLRLTDSFFKGLNRIDHLTKKSRISFQDNNMVGNGIADIKHI